LLESCPFFLFIAWQRATAALVMQVDSSSHPAASEAAAQSLMRPGHGWLRWLVGGLKLALMAVLCWFIYTAFASGRETLQDHTWTLEPAWLVFSGALYLAGMFPAAVYWYVVLVKAGQHVGFGESIRAYYISQLGKYVPGKWMVILLRRTLLRDPRVETTVVAASVFFETLSMLAVGAAISALVLLVWHPRQQLLIATAVGSSLLLGIPTVPSVFQWLIHVLRVGKLNPTAGAKFRRLGAGTITIGWLSMAAGWLVQGMALWATLRALSATNAGPLGELSLHTTAVALGVVAGFLSQIPGGLAVREWVSGELMVPQYGAAIGMISAVVFRLVLLVSELVISTILYFGGWRRGTKPTARIEAELTASGRS
jgi:uncharacterized membrane protein YbhN (UPF0104 family)